MGYIRFLTCRTVTYCRLIPRTLSEYSQVSEIDASGVFSLPLRRFASSEFSEDQFRAIWVQGEPIVVQDPSNIFNVSWSPSYFVERFRNSPCNVEDCNGVESVQQTTIGNFFSRFGDYRDRNIVLKLKVLFLISFIQMNR